MTKINKNTKVVLDSKGVITLRPSDHIATGGEGSVYRKSKTIIKLYENPRRMTDENLVAKIKLLSKFKHEFVVSPGGIVSDKRGNPIGFHMPFVKGEALSRIFTNDFRTRNRFGDSEACTLVDGMREAVQFAHSKGAVMVDANEFNWLVKLGRKKVPELRIIDVDSWAVGQWGASVVMPSIRDWSTKDFNQKTDWFAWGIVTFQVFTGIHPYKGRLKGYKPFDLKKRMQDNASVFRSGVRLNRAVRDFGAIPGPLLDWYVATFEKGNRTLPPSPFDTGAGLAQVGRVLRVVNTDSGSLIFDLLYKGETVEFIYPSGAVRTKTGKLIDLQSGSVITTNVTPNAEVVRVENGWLCADESVAGWEFYHVNSVSKEKTTLNSQVKFTRILRYENRLFGVGERGITEIVVKIFSKPVLSFGNTWSVMVNSVKWFDGVGVQDAFGAVYLILPFGENKCAQVRVRELDGKKVVNARAGSRFATVIVLDKSGNYTKFEFSFGREYQNYKPWSRVTDSPNLNIAILPKGVCATIVEDGKLDIFVPSSATLNSVKDKDISTGLALTNWDNKVVYIKNGQVWQVRLK